MTAKKRKRNKYGNIRVVDVETGRKFDSRKEYARYLVLKKLQEESHIRDLCMQPSYTLKVGDQKICAYKADFTYTTADGRTVVEDVKPSPKRVTPLFRLKKKLMRILLGIDVVEIYDVEENIGG